VSSLEHRRYKIRELIEAFRTGNLVIPEFQRDYVWKPSMAVKLLESIYLGYPISSLLIWESDGDVMTRKKERGRNQPGRSARWLVDGQQRVTTLARAMTGDEGINVSFNTRTQEFKTSNAATNASPDFYEISDIWDDDSYRRLRRSFAGSPHVDLFEENMDKVRSILDYEIPAVHMIDHPFKDAVEAFRRINTLGTKLKKPDIESAQVAAKHSGFIRSEVIPTVERLRKTGFDRIHVSHLFRACAFIAHPDGRRRTPLHELSPKEVEQAWKSTMKGLEKAENLVRSELGLVNMRILWSGALLVPPIVLCATLRPGEFESSAVAAWMALAALHHRYSGASETALDQDLRACRSKDPVGALLTNLRKKRALAAHSADFSGSMSDKSSLFASYVACKHRGAKDLLTGQNILLQSRIDRHHIVPRSLYSAAERSRADTLANIAFIDRDANSSINNSDPEDYLKKVKAETRRSQCIPEDPRLWIRKNDEKFWAERRELLATSFNDYLKLSLENRHIH
jgi:hypothetical protein